MRDESREPGPLDGQYGEAQRGIYPIFEKGNMLGLCDMGALPEYLPGYQDAASVRDLFERVWKTGIPYTKGRTIPEIVRGLENGDVRAVYIAGADPLTDYPNAGVLPRLSRKQSCSWYKIFFPVQRL